MSLRSGVVLAALCIAPSAHAHLRFPAVKAERWIEIRLNEDPIRIGYRIGYGAELAKQLRKAADTDGDGSVVAAEGNAALDARTASLLEALTVCTGPSLDALECGKLGLRDVELVEAEGWVPGATGHLHFAWTLRLADGAHQLGAIRVEDAWDVAGVEVSDVQIAPAPGRPLTSAGEGPSPTAVASAFTWIEARRGSGPRVITATWPGPRGPNVPLLAVGLALAVAGIGAWVYARHRSHASRQSS